MRWLLFCLSLLIIGSTSAQESPWSVYLYNNSDKTLLRINANGTQSTIPLNLPADIYISTWEMAFSPDGNTLAFCTSDWTQATEVGVPSAFTIMDLTSGSTLHQIELGNTQGCRAAGFSADGSLVSLSRFNYYLGQAGMDTSLPAWESQLFNVTTGEVVNQFSSNSPELLVMDELLREFPIMPEVRDFTDTSLVFLAVPWGIGGIPEVDAYRWNFGTDGNFSRDPYWGAYSADSLPDTGEMVWLEYDANLPAGNPGGPIASFNVVKYLAPDGTESVVYTNTEWVIVNAMFVNDGQQVAIMLLESFDAEANEELTIQNTQWILLNRDGTTTDLGTYGTFTELTPAPTGLLMLETKYTQEDFQPPILFTLQYYVAGGFIDLWTQQTDDEAASWQIAYVTPFTTPADLPPFTPGNE